MTTEKTASPTVGQKFAADLSGDIRARSGLIWLVTREEARAERLIVEACGSAGYEPRFWDCAVGWTDLAGRKIPPGAVVDPGAALASIRESEEQARVVYVMRDLGAFLTTPFDIRSLRSLVRALPLRPRERAGTIIVLGPRAEIPPELQGHALVRELPLPDRAEISDVLSSVLENNFQDTGARSAACPNGTADAAIDAAVGLSESETQAMMQRSLVSTRRIDPTTIRSEKKRIVNGTRGLEWIEPDPRGLDAIGGLENMKAWLKLRRVGFGRAAREYGIRPPHGVLLVGVSGNGKSLTAKAVPTAWGLPCLKVDLGSIKDKFVGNSEAGLRAAFRMAAAVAPVVLWFDEVEKSLSGATQGAADGGVSGDVLYTLLGFLQDLPEGVVVIATANDVSAIPPELLRKGRFDEIFFIDLPSETERAAILAASLRMNNRTEKIDLAAVAAVTEGFVGAELAALVPDSLFAAFADGARPITTADLINSAKATVPLSKTAPEKIAAIRKWGAERARPASATVVAAPRASSPTLDL